MLRAIVFDFDGVIANSEPLHFRAYQRVLAAEQVTLTERDYYARYLGFDDVGAFAAIGADNRRVWTPERIGDLVARKAIEFEALERNISVLFPGAADAIRRAARALPIAIASGARGEEIRRVLARERLDACFTAIVAAEDTPRSKPAPDPYLHVLSRLADALGGALAIALVAQSATSARTIALTLILPPRKNSDRVDDPGPDSDAVRNGPLSGIRSSITSARAGSKGEWA